ncbi:MAG: DUF1015 domain-containing protein [Clostridia bacterium]|nr:DUF1015 domain-containing protein [Clostridia bacterium]
MQFFGIRPADIYLPAPGIDQKKWAVVACDQFTSDPAYWQKIEDEVGDAPSALRIIYPEVYLSEGEGRIPRIRAAMEKYLQEGSLSLQVENGFVLMERNTESGSRIGLVAAVDLEDYDYTPGTSALIRATEGTILSRIPPRVKIREGAPLESPHVMLLMDDKDDQVLGELYKNRENLRPVYDTALMAGGGTLKGWAITDENQKNALYASLKRLCDACNGFLFAVGDGNHSLATAKACWENRKKEISQAEQETDPARFALVEIVNLHSPALQFEPIHRMVFGADGTQMMLDFAAYLREKGMASMPGKDITFLHNGQETGLSVKNAGNMLPVAILQPFLDRYLQENKDCEIDYIHEADAVENMSRDKGTGILLTAIEKSSLFPGIVSGGVLPRKTFSMGHGHEKRYYMECRKIK